MQQCTGKVFVTPDIALNECAKKQEKANLSAIVHLVTNAGMGCDRDTYEASDAFTLCGPNDFVDLLPRPGVGREWTEGLRKNSKGMLVLVIKTTNTLYTDIVTRALRTILNNLPCDQSLVESVLKTKLMNSFCLVNFSGKFEPIMDISIY